MRFSPTSLLRSLAPQASPNVSVAEFDTYPPATSVSRGNGVAVVGFDSSTTEQGPLPAPAQGHVLRSEVASALATTRVQGIGPNRVASSMTFPS